MNCLRWYGSSSSAHLVNCAFDRLITINCAAFDELRNILSIALCTCIRVKVRTRGLESGLGYWIRFRVRVRLWLGLGLRNWPNAQRIWSNAHIDQMRLTG